MVHFYCEERQNFRKYSPEFKIPYIIEKINIKYIWGAHQNYLMFFYYCGKIKNKNKGV